MGAYDDNRPGLTEVVMQMKDNAIKHKGFTLVELMVVLAILALLVGVALPAYDAQVTKTRRSDAKTALTQAAALQERYYMRTTPSSYAGAADIDKIGGSSSPEGHYTITVDITGCSGGRPNGSCYQLTATPTAGGAQVNDTACASFVITDTGAKTATGTLGDECW